jgi:hypothetical protein
LSYLRFVGKRAGVLVFAAVAVCALAPITSCLDATEIVLQLSTDVPCDTVRTTKVLIHVGSLTDIDTNPPTQIESVLCNSGDATASPLNDLGTVAVLPSNGFDAPIAISVALSDALNTGTSSCYPEAQGAASCIYAHRQITFLPHTRVTLPIILSSLCAGVQCTSPSTCGPDGRCTSGNVDPHDCGSSCTTGEDSGSHADVTIDVPVSTVDASKDAPIFDGWIFLDATADGPECAPNQLFCNGQCANVLSDAKNCGACGVDCTGSNNCSNGTCILEKSVAGTCLAVANNTVYVATASGVYTYPSNGGTGTLYNNASDTISAMASMPGHIGWYGSNAQQAYVWDLATKQSFSESTVSLPQLMALNGGAYAWFDAKQGHILYQPLQQVTATAYAPTLNTTSPIPIAMGTKYVYASIPLSNELLWTDGTSYAYIANVTNPTAIIVDDPSKPAPIVFDVEKNTAVVQRDSLLANAKPYATSSTTITSMVWDGTKVLANASSQISYASGSSFVSLATANPAPKCIAVDSNAVYWLDATAGLFKHAKP